MSFVSDFGRSNRRMHNKSFTVDNQAAVVGGRNIGNEYFAAGEGVAFIDLDALLTGAVVPAVSRQFDTYWNSASAYPASQLLSGADESSLVERFAATRADPEAVRYLDAIRTTPVVRQLQDRTLPFEWTHIDVISDDPAKTLDTTGARHDLLLFPRLIQAFGRPTSSFDLITPYFVPGDAGTEALAELARTGVTVRILTNSLAGSDVSAVHAGYAKRRVDLLRAGVRLFELKPTAGVRPADQPGVGSSSSSGLHAKTFAVDRRRVFIGSFNFDPRSARLNTELGLVIDSVDLAQRLQATFDREFPQVAYEVRLADDGTSLQWIDRSATGEQRFSTEPGTGWWKRFKVDVLSVLPIEWLL
jgi:putative cardiolipin synthase